MADTKLFINGEWAEAASGETFPTHAPSTGEKIADVAKAGREDAQRAIAAARKAFDDGPWPRMAGKERAEKLRAQLRRDFFEARDRKRERQVLRLHEISLLDDRRRPSVCGLEHVRP